MITWITIFIFIAGIVFFVIGKILSDRQISRILSAHIDKSSFSKNQKEIIIQYRRFFIVTGLEALTGAILIVIFYEKTVWILNGLTIIVLFTNFIIHRKIKRNIKSAS